MKPSVSDFAFAEDSGENRVRIRSRIDPISLQADGKRKAAFQAALGQAVQKATTGIYIHDVKVTRCQLRQRCSRARRALVRAAHAQAEGPMALVPSEVRRCMPLTRLDA